MLKFFKKLLEIVEESNKWIKEVQLKLLTRGIDKEIEKEEENKKI